MDWQNDAACKLLEELPVVTPEQKHRASCVVRRFARNNRESQEFLDMLDLL